MQFSFGSGVLIGTRTDIAVPTPRAFGILQEASVDFQLTNKELMGQYSFPVAVARGSGKISGKAKFANINAAMYNDLFFQGSLGNNEARVAVNEAGTPTTNSFTVANSASWLEDLGVFNRNTNRFMERVSSAPATGQYSVTAGVYTFAAADSNPPCYFTYRYSFTTTTGKTLTISNQLQGINPAFSLVMATQHNGQQFNLKLNACTSTKLTLNAKIEDWMVPDFDFSAYADGSGVIGTLSMGE